MHHILDVQLAYWEATQQTLDSVMHNSILFSKSGSTDVQESRLL